MLRIQTQASDELQTTILSGQDESSNVLDLAIKTEDAIELDSTVPAPQLYTLSAKNSLLYIPPLLDSLVKVVTIATDLNSIQTSPALIGIASGTQFLHSAGLNVKSSAENCVAIGNMVRFSVFPEEWPVLSKCKRIIAFITALPPTFAATISDASQTFFLIRMVGTYRYLNLLPSIAWDITGGVLGIATAWTTFSTKGPETVHAASSILGKGEQYPNRIIQYTMDGVSWVCGSSALVHETAITFVSMSTICVAMSIPVEKVKYELAVLCLNNGIATACYEKAFMVNALQKSYRCVADNNFTRRNVLSLSISMGLSLLILLEMPFNRISYRNTMDSFDLPDNESTDLGIQIIAGYVFASMYVVGAIALYEPVSQISNWLELKMAGGYRFIGRICNYIGDTFWQAIVPQKASEDEASQSLLGHTDNLSDEEPEKDEENHLMGINHPSIQVTEEEPSPHITQGLFAHKPAKAQKDTPKNVMRCGLF